MNRLERILLVDDSEQDVELTLAALSDHDLVEEVRVLHDGAEALDYLQRRGAFSGREGGDPAVVLLDVKMPRVDGLKVLREVKADERLRTIPVVMLTSSREERDLMQSYELGANAYVVKPVDFSEFSQAVAQLGSFWALLNVPPPGSVPRLG
jgi:CheY-like chemotaxis protein